MWRLCFPEAGCWVWLVTLLHIWWKRHTKRMAKTEATPLGRCDPASCCSECLVSTSFLKPMASPSTLSALPLLTQHLLPGFTTIDNFLLLASAVTLCKVLCWPQRCPQGARRDQARPDDCTALWFKHHWVESAVASREEEGTP